MSAAKVFCFGGGVEVGEVRRAGGSEFVQCPECKRILKPTKTGKFRQHQTPNVNTRSLDKTREILWERARRVLPREHFAIGLMVRVVEGCVPAGWPEGDDFGEYFDAEDYGRYRRISDVADDGTFETQGWYWWPQDLVAE